MIGTPHEESIAMILSTETCQIKRNRRNPAKSSSNPRTPKNPKSSPLTHGFGRGITAQRTTRVPKNFPHQIPKIKVLKTPQENHQERALKITTNNNREQHHKVLRNHVESSIHAKKVHTRSS
jgi:hypothetical protein